MSYEIQEGIFCENCIKCGARPVIEQKKKGDWVILCPNAACKNSVTGSLIDFETWNRINKKSVDLKSGKNDLMRSA